MGGNDIFFRCVTFNNMNLSIFQGTFKHIPQVLANTFQDTEHFTNKKSCFSLIPRNLEYFGRLVLHCRTSPLSITTVEYRLAISASSVVENTLLLVNACESFFVMIRTGKHFLQIPDSLLLISREVEFIDFV